MSARLDIAPVHLADVRALEDELGVSFVLAQVLARRGLTDPAAARALLAADERHDARRFAGLGTAADLVLGHVRAGSRIIVHGDYDADGVCSTAILVRALRALGADVDWYLPSRTDDGYGLARGDRRAPGRPRHPAARHGRLRDHGGRRGRGGARGLGLDVVVTDHHAPARRRAAARRTDRPPGRRPLPVPRPLRRRRRPQARRRAARRRGPRSGAGRRRPRPRRDRHRRGLRAPARREPAPRARGPARPARNGEAGAAGARCAWPRSTPPRSTPARSPSASRRGSTPPGASTAPTRASSSCSATTRTAPRRSRPSSTPPTPSAGTSRPRILFDAERLVAETGEAPAYVLAGEDWHPGVIGIVASRIAERHHRPCVLVALDGERGTGSGRSIPAFDLLAGLEAGGGPPRAPRRPSRRRGLQVRARMLDAFRAAFEAHAGERAQARRPRAARARRRRRRRRRARPRPRRGARGARAVRDGQPRAVAARPGRPALRSAGDGGGAPSCASRSRRAAPGPAPSPSGRRRCPTRQAVDAMFAPRASTSGAARWSPGSCCGARVPRRRRRSTLAGEPEDALSAGPAPSSGRRFRPPPPRRRAGPVRDRRGGGTAGVVAALVATGEPVLVVCADARARRRHLAGRLGGFGLAS